MTDTIYDLTVWKNNSTVLNNFKNYLSFINECQNIQYTIDSGETVQLYVISRVASCCRTFETFMKSMTILKHFINTHVLKNNKDGDKHCEKVLPEIVDTVEKTTEYIDECKLPSKNKYIYVVSVNSCDGDLSKSQCIIGRTKDDAITIAFNSAVSQDFNSKFDETGCYNLSTHVITTHCLLDGIYGPMNSLYRKPKHDESESDEHDDEKHRALPIMTGNVHIDYDIDFGEIFTDKKEVSHTNPHVEEEDNETDNIDLHQMNHSPTNMRDINELRRRQLELSRFGRGRSPGSELERFQGHKMGMDSDADFRNDDLERERIFNGRYNLHRRRNPFMGESSYPKRCNFRSYEHINFTETGTVTSGTRDPKKIQHNYDDYDTNFWSTDDSEEDDVSFSEVVSDSGIKITVIGDSNEDLSGTTSKHTQELVNIENTTTNEL